MNAFFRLLDMKEGAPVEPATPAKIELPVNSKWLEDMASVARDFKIEREQQKQSERVNYRPSMFIRRDDFPIRFCLNQKKHLEHTSQTLHGNNGSPIYIEKVLVHIIDVNTMGHRIWSAGTITFQRFSEFVHHNAINLNDDHIFEINRTGEGTQTRYNFTVVK